jgi:hypothetical protein
VLHGIPKPFVLVRAWRLPVILITFTAPGRQTAYNECSEGLEEESEGSMITPHKSLNEAFQKKTVPNKTKVYACAYWIASTQQQKKGKLRVSPGSNLVGIQKVLERHGVSIVAGSLKRIY